jgi:hypothetical protein
MIVKIYSKIGPLYFLIKEEKLMNPNELDVVVDQWRYANLVEVFNDNGELVLAYKDGD